MSDDIIVPGHVADARRKEAQAQQRPVAGLMIAGYGSYVNASLIAKMEPVQQGRDWFVVAYLNSVNETASGNLAFLTPPLTTEQEASRACDAIAEAIFFSFSSREEGGAHWRWEQEDQGLVSMTPVIG